MTLEMEQGTYGRPAADAFDLPAALAARERRAAERGLGGGAQRSAHVTTDRATTLRSDGLPQEFVPWSDR